MMGKANYVGLVGGGKQPKFAGNKASHDPTSQVTSPAMLLGMR